MKKVFLTILIIVFITVLYAFTEPFLIEDKVIYISDRDVPQEFIDCKIIFLTDIHHGPFFSEARLERLVKKVNSLHPDIILLGGDYVHRKAEYIPGCFKALSGLKPDIGTYGVLGNHDHWEDATLTINAMKKAGITYIGNDSEWIEQGRGKIKIGGVGDLYMDVQDIDKTIHDVVSGDFTILISHNPDYAEYLYTDKIDLVLSGHTHGGQVTFFGIWAPLLPSAYGQKYRTGLIAADNFMVIVSNGIGTITPPARFFARPQIVTVILKNEIGDGTK
jgi:uncharacterized protein